MRISDWSSDVCASDLLQGRVPACHQGRSAAGLESEARSLQAQPCRGEAEARDAPILAKMPRCADRGDPRADRWLGRSEEHTSELQSLMRISYAVFCLKKKKEE